MSTWREMVLLVCKTDPDGGIEGEVVRLRQENWLGLISIQRGMLIPDAYETTLGLWPSESLGVRGQGRQPAAFSEGETLILKTARAKAWTCSPRNCGSSAPKLPPGTVSTV